MTVVSEASDGTCQLRSGVNNASMYLSARLPNSAPAAPLSSSCGSEVGRAWTVSVKAGQLINFTLIDLTPSQSRLHACYVYAVLVERAVERVPLCAGQQANVTYTSTSNVVNVTFYHQLNRHVSYVLKYEGKHTHAVCWTHWSGSVHIMCCSLRPIYYVRGVCLITVLTVVQTVLTATFNSYGNRQILTPPTKSIPLNRSTKNRHN